MADFNEHQLRKITKSINNFDSTYTGLSKKISNNSLEREISRSIQDFNNYIKICDSTLNDVQKAMTKAIAGNGFLFRTEGFNDVINQKINQAGAQIDKLLNVFNREIDSIIAKLGSLDEADLILSSADYSGDVEFDEEILDCDATNLDDPLLSFANVEQNNVFVDLNDLEEQSSETTDDSEKFIDSLSDIFTSDELTAKNPAEVVVESEEKKVIITKKTALDTVELRNLFIKRNRQYDLNLEQINNAIAIVGNDVDKHAILREALKIKINDDINKSDFFYLNASFKYLVKFYNDEENYVAALNAVMGLFYLASSGYRMVSTHARDKQLIEHVYIEPKMETQLLLQVNGQLNYSSDQLVKEFIKSEYVIRLSKVLQRPFYSVANSAKIMIMSYNNPYEYLNCKDLAIPYAK